MCLHHHRLLRGTWGDLAGVGGGHLLGDTGLASQEVTDTALPDPEAASTCYRARANERGWWSRCLQAMPTPEAPWLG